MVSQESGILATDNVANIKNATQLNHIFVQPRTTRIIVRGTTHMVIFIMFCNILAIDRIDNIVQQIHSHVLVSAII